MKILVTIANFGTSNDKYLYQVLDEFRRIPYDVDLVVTSNMAKHIGSDVEVIPGLPSKDPWSLPFAHKRVFAERQDAYDLFIYSEDDILITLRNVDAFLRATDILRHDQLAGFIRSEIDGKGGIYFPDIHFHFHWDVESVTWVGDRIFAHFTNLHSGCYMLTKQQLKRAIATGGFLTPPNEGVYDMMATAATDPYTKCGFRKMICISDIEDFILPHLSNRYATKSVRPELSVPAADVYAQLKALSSLSKNGKSRRSPFQVESNVAYRRWSKSYYECCQESTLSLIPQEVKTVLSIGCGWGLTEERLIERGMRVKAIPLDSVIAASAESRGIEIISTESGHLNDVLKGQLFDCILVLNILHLMPDPIEFLISLVPFCQACIIASVPNVSRVRRVVRRVQLRSPDANPKSYKLHKMHATTGRVLRRWFRQAGLKPIMTTYEISKSQESANRRLFGLASSSLAETVCVLASVKRLNSSQGQQVLTRVLGDQPGDHAGSLTPASSAGEHTHAS